jgi:transcriptional regulator with XRE-family HTH domain
VPRPRKKRAGTAETVGDRIRRFRLAKGLSQTELGKRLGVSQRVVTYYEVRGISPTPDLLIKLADALGVSTDMLLGRKALPRQVAVLSEGSLRRWRRLKRLEELPRHDQMAVLKMIEALADRAEKRKRG